MNDVVLLQHAKQLLNQADGLRASLEELLAELAEYERDLVYQLEEGHPLEEHSEAGSGGAQQTAEQQPTSPATEHRERRLSSRRKCMPVPVLLSFSKHGSDPFPGWVVDASDHGLGIYTNSDIAVGTLLVARPKNAPARCRWVKMEVRHCRTDHDRWFIGCRFVHKLLIEDLDLFRH